MSIDKQHTKQLYLKAQTDDVCIDLYHFLNLVFPECELIIHSDDSNRIPPDALLLIEHFGSQSDIMHTLKWHHEHQLILICSERQHEMPLDLLTQFSHVKASFNLNEWPQLIRFLSQFFQQNNQLDFYSFEDLNLLIDSAMDGMIIINQNQQIVKVNQAAQKMFGYKELSLLGHNLSRLLPERFQQHHSSYVKQFGLTPSSNRKMGENSFVFGLRRSGDEFPIEASIFRFELQSRLFMGAIIRDVSERVRFEAQLIKAQKLENISLLSSGVAHNMSNLLMPILMSAESLQQTPDLTETQKRSTELIKECAQQAIEIIRQMLALSKPQFSYQEPIQVSLLLASLVNLAQKSFPSTVQIIENIDADLWLILGDKSQLQQALLNVLLNAKDALIHGGSITLSAHNIYIEETSDSHQKSLQKPHICISIHDTGIGILPEHLDSIFEPFISYKKTAQGTGLGLSSTLSIIQQHQGKIDVQSAPNKGTRFSILLPAMIEEDELLQVEASLVLKGNGESILLIEPADVLAEVIQLTLEQNNYFCHRHNRVLDSLIWASNQTQPYLAVFISTDLTDIEHYQLASIFRQMKRVQHIVFLYTPGQSIVLDDLNQDTHYLAKPFSSQQLLFFLSQLKLNSVQNT